MGQTYTAHVPVRSLDLDSWGDLPPALLLAAPRRFVAARRAYRYECDVIGHINNTVYPTWLDEALADALAATGLPTARPGGPGLRLAGTWYHLDYLRPAAAGDPLT